MANPFSNYYIGFFYALGASFTASIYIISVAKIKNEVTTSVLMIYSAISTIFIAIIVGFVEAKRNLLLNKNIHFFYMDKTELLGYFGIAIMGLIATFMVTQSCKMADPSTISFVRSLEIVFAFMAEYLFGHSSIHILSISGATLIICSVIAKPLEEKIMDKLTVDCTKYC